ncbi:MAG: aspartate/glutamate racemase family protein [Moraxella sp.]|nr:aspartate/glutamate racemase family protein [Moraxella sp.]
MKTLGVIGGMSPASTATYYNEINQAVNQAKGANTTAPLIVYSVDFEPIVQCQRQNDWQTAGELLTNIAQRLEQIGADGILLATNTMHKVAPVIKAGICVPFLHIVDATAHAIIAQNIHKVALLGTKFVMSESFYQDGLAKYGIQSLVPNAKDQDDIHRIIFDELCVGKVCEASKRIYLNVINDLKSQGVDAVILGCTEIGLLVNQNDLDILMFDTAKLHAQMAVDFILKD